MSLPQHPLDKLCFPLGVAFPVMGVLPLQAELQATVFLHPIRVCSQKVPKQQVIEQLFMPDGKHVDVVSDDISIGPKIMPPGDSIFAFIEVAQLLQVCDEFISVPPDADRDVDDGLGQQTRHRRTADVLNPKGLKAWLFQQTVLLLPKCLRPCRGVGMQFYFSSF